MAVDKLLPELADALEAAERDRDAALKALQGLVEVAESTMAATINKGVALPAKAPRGAALEAARHCLAVVARKEQP